MVQIAEALTLARAKFRVEQLIFGDLHLESIRHWREETFGKHVDIGDIQLHFPLWKKPYEELQELLFGSGAKVTISACTEDFGGLIKIGMEFNRAFIQSLPEGCDKFGETGEFHTLVKVKL